MSWASTNGRASRGWLDALRVKRRFLVSRCTQDASPGGTEVVCASGGRASFVAVAPKRRPGVRAGPMKLANTTHEVSTPKQAMPRFTTLVRLTWYIGGLRNGNRVTYDG